MPRKKRVLEVGISQLLPLAWPFTELYHTPSSDPKSPQVHLRQP